MKDVLISERFDDIYFSKEDGLAETAHVFLNGNNLPSAWEGKGNFTIFETGFGTGLNFFSAWKLFEETIETGQHLDFISIEKFPLKPDKILRVLDPWLSFFEGRVEHFIKLYSIRISGFHRIQVMDNITLTLIFDDINEALPQVQADIDCWFLDGFTPAKNPDMWTDVLYKNMARLSVSGASYATFTAAGNVRRGLENAGFSVEKKKGFGQKREMIVGSFTKPSSRRRTGSCKAGKDSDLCRNDKNIGKKIAIIGGGLAGASCAYVLKQYGFDPVIYEASDGLGSGASGNNVGLYNPRFSKRRDALSDFFAPAYAQLIRVAKQARDDIDYTPCGALHLMNDDKKRERYSEMARNWGWGDAHIQVVDAVQASEIAGITLHHDALYLPDSGTMNPQKLCEYYARDVEVHYNSVIQDINDLEEDIVILACGAAVNKFKELPWLELENVRGQVSDVAVTDISKNLKCNLHYGSYISAPRDGVHSVGSTFEKWIDHTDVTNENHEENLHNLKSNIEILANSDFQVTGGRAGMRAATNDRFPVIGAVPNHKNIYVSTAFGSHGIVSSIMGAHVIGDLVRGGASCLPVDVLYQLSPRRFIDRAAKKGRVLV